MKLVGERHGTSAAAVAIAWTLAWPGVTGAIVGAREPAQVDGWIDAATLHLRKADLDEIAATIKRTGAGSGPSLPAEPGQLGALVAAVAGDYGCPIMYAVKEMFYTLQGEGTHTGRAAVFCRFAGCNLWSGREQDRAKAECQFCDTDFVGVDGEGGGKFTTADDLADACAQVAGRCRGAVRRADRRRADAAGG